MTYVKSMAQQGIAPLVDLSAMLRQFEQLKQPETRPMQTGTVRDQINMASQARNAGLGAFQMQPTQTAPQIATQPMMSPQMAAPQMAPQASGIASLDAGAMENPRGFNMGGIVAFDQGGVSASTPPTPPIVAANLPKPRSDQERYDFFANVLKQGYVPAYQQERNILDKIEKEEGIGEYAESIRQEADLLKRQGERSLEELEIDKRNLGRQEAADIAGYATKSRSALEAMAKARSAAVTRERDLEKEIRAARNEREKAAINLTKAKETAATTKSTTARARVDKYQDKLDETEKTLNDRLFEREKLDKQIQGQIRVAGVEAASRENLARLEANLKMGLTERAGQIERDIKMGTASAEDQLGWDYITTLRAKGADDEATKAAFEKYKEAMELRYARSNSGLVGPGGKPLAVPPSGAPDTSSGSWSGQKVD
jgi:hypothetical protein